MKSHTDLEQSKTLEKILPLESADMLWEQHYNNEPIVTIKPWTTIVKVLAHTYFLVGVLQHCLIYFHLICLNLKEA